MVGSWGVPGSTSLPLALSGADGAARAAAWCALEHCESSVQEARAGAASGQAQGRVPGCNGCVHCRDEGVQSGSREAQAHANASAATCCSGCSVGRWRRVDAQTHWGGTSIVVASESRRHSGVQPASKTGVVLGTRVRSLVASRFDKLVPVGGVRAATSSAVRSHRVTKLCCNVSNGFRQ